MGYRDDLAAGRVAFAHLIRVWHERNGWNHKVLPALAEALDLGRVHNSQISMLRNGKLASPGPEVFLALGRINQLLAEGLGSRLAGSPELQAALEASALPVQDEGAPVLGPGELLEVFVGLRPPPVAFDLRIGDGEAPALSAALAQLLTAGRPWRLCREQLMAAYPAEKRQRRERFAEVMTGQRDYSAVELDSELPELRRTLARLGATAEGELEPDQFLQLLRSQARLLAPEGSTIVPAPDLGVLVRQRIRHLDERSAG